MESIFKRKHKFEEIMKKLVGIENSIANQKVHLLEFFPFEEVMTKEFYQSFITNDLTEKYNKLKKGLDYESIQLLDKLLYRIQEYARYGTTHFVVDEKEYFEILNVVYHLEHRIVLSDEYISVNGYCLPKEFQFSSSSVVYRHFIESIKDKNKILNGDIIDAGAYIGDSALVLSSYTNGFVHAFEPEDKNYELMKKTIKVNELKEKIIPIKMGLGGEIETKTLTAHGSGSIVSQLTESVETVDMKKISMTTIDSYVEKHNLKIGLIKADIEGLEQDLIKGAINTIGS